VEGARSARPLLNRVGHATIARIPTLKPNGRLGLVLHPRTDPTPVVEKLTSWARAHTANR
jgi:hypothetical protein